LDSKTDDTCYKGICKSVADDLFQQTACCLVPGASFGPLNDVARLDHPVHHTALGNVELEKIGFIEASPVLQDLEEKNECTNRKCLNTKERLQ
jgi:hypothetical protein